jgi:hypothetical protein
VLLPRRRPAPCPRGDPVPGARGQLSAVHHG